MSSTLKAERTARLRPGLVPGKHERTGLLMAGAVLGAWSLSLAALLTADLALLAPPVIAGAVLLRTFLHTGLFITGHDAMHRSIYPADFRLNDLVGTLAVTLYGFLPYRELLIKHQMHHRFPASDKDPDYHDGEHTGFWGWYVTFMRDYMESRHTGWQMIGMSLFLVSCTWLLGIAPLNLALFYLLPLVLSSLQLFYFGTYLPHRQPRSGYRDNHRAESSQFAPLWSFLSCYHFGYHWEHHEYPQVPWYRLPRTR